jgi:hypothetical protein
MRVYRLYVYGSDGHICRRVDLNCADEESALNAMIEHDDGVTVLELWEGRRFVAARNALSGPETAA